MNRHHRRQAKDADRILARIDGMEIRMSAASDALMKGLADLSAKLATQVADIETARAAGEAAQAAKDDATFAEANEKVKTMLANLGPHVEAIGQMADAVASGAGTSAAAAQPVVAPAAEPAPAPAEKPAQADPAPAAADMPAEAAPASEAPSDGTPAKISGDVVITTEPSADADASAEDAAATSRRKR